MTGPEVNSELLCRVKHRDSRETKFTVHQGTSH